MPTDQPVDKEESRLLTQLRELDAALAEAHIPFALIGGVAVNAHGFLRATHDLDILVLAEHDNDTHRAISSLGYQTLDRRPDISSYVRPPLRLDVLHAHRSITRDLLARAETADYRDIQVRIVPVEGLIGLKIQAFRDDPRRIRDLDDIIQLLKINRTRLNLDEVRTYFRLFDREALFDDILRSLD